MQAYEESAHCRMIQISLSKFLSLCRQQFDHLETAALNSVVVDRFQDLEGWRMVMPGSLYATCAACQIYAMLLSWHAGSHASLVVA